MPRSRENTRETWDNVHMDKHTNKNETEVVTEHAHTYRNTCDTLTRFVVQKEIVGSGRFRDCWLVPKNREREAKTLHFLFIFLRDMLLK